ncbi:NAD(P)-dependent dehydrogenase (short-subunit alcohol dehydrogenase family) [Amycolatopsis bartoniae]|uniref:Short-chain dehydrogenase n=1 Tax=Amycolatopsis bartoniae TaxID=941986 RepID=A0A8H9MGC7_9PSEU|nr:SDR family oxidoreductase [Amycolatopsis bartoniae]MBB2938690.1 NAD(P)-dependent dehydrogenase (short-subunit alcohol dehydrogenase family) [Amycolatopsis bartoniae]TVT11523.1 SDR family oxidoreductase [Amycolatopsis bartoniae]GHF79445.1 short-chain dehydrogenase [Amycolatopsis bartoniae]
MGKYDGRNVVITGGSSGFGLTTAERLVAGGARVLITGRTQETLDAARARLGDNAIAVRSDAASLSDIDELADRVKTEFGTVDALFVNAGVSGFAPFEGTTEEEYDRLLTINAKGPYFTVQKLAPLLNEGSGVVLTTSVVNVLGYPGVSAYAASKAALRSMARSLARELLPRGIRVNAVSPGPIDTGILDKQLPKEVAEQTKAHMRENNPMLRFGKPEEITNAVLFLAFDATFTTGAELPVDGGGTQL